MDAFGCWIGLLIALQAEPSFAVRETATESLGCFGEAASPWLAATRAHPDAEVVWRSARLLDRNHVAWLDSLGKLPWIDALPVSCRDRGLIVSEHLTDNASGSPPDWPGFRQATRNWLADRLRLGMDRRTVLEILAVMREREAHWWTHRRYPD